MAALEESLGAPVATAGRLFCEGESLDTAAVPDPRSDAAHGRPHKAYSRQTVCPLLRGAALNGDHAARLKELREQEWCAHGRIISHRSSA